MNFRKYTIISNILYQVGFFNTINDCHDHCWEGIGEGVRWDTWDQETQTSPNFIDNNWNFCMITWWNRNFLLYNSAWLLVLCPDLKLTELDLEVQSILRIWLNIIKIFSYQCHKIIEVGKLVTECKPSKDKDFNRRGLQLLKEKSKKTVSQEKYFDWCIDTYYTTT